VAGRIVSDRFQNQLGAIVLALLALGGFALIGWQVVHGHEPAAILVGITTTAIGVLSPSPLKGTQTVTVDQPANNPIPVNDAA
jgi:hypothetical protein